MIVKCPHCHKDHDVAIGVSDSMRQAIELAVLEQIHLTLNAAAKIQAEVVVHTRETLTKAREPVLASEK